MSLHLPPPAITWQRGDSSLFRLARSDFRRIIPALGKYTQIPFSNVNPWTHLQTIEFQITRLIVDQLTSANHATTDRRRRVLALQSRHQLFPQVFRYVEEYVGRKINLQGCDPCELGLEKYVQRMVERLRDGIVPDDTEGEAPLMPIINRYKPIGCTAEVDFKTTRPCHMTMKSHIDQVVLDNLFWEASTAFRLESSDSVLFYARNDHMGLTIPYGVHGYRSRVRARLPGAPYERNDGHRRSEGL